MKNLPALPACTVSAYLRRTQAGTPIIRIRLITPQAAQFRTYHPEQAEPDAAAPDCQAVHRALARALQSASIPCAWLWLSLPLGQESDSRTEGSS